jgi:hypothetical protein
MSCAAKQYNSSNSVRPLLECNLPITDKLLAQHNRQVHKPSKRIFHHIFNLFEKKLITMFMVCLLCTKNRVRRTEALFLCCRDLLKRAR